MSDTLHEDVKSVDIIPLTKSDHSAITLVFCGIDSKIKEDQAFGNLFLPYLTPRSIIRYSAETLKCGKKIKCNTTFYDGLQ